MRESTVSIAGAGPSGLAAAIVLARQGERVRVAERRSTVGARFHDDLQGLENWSDALDILDEFRAAGVKPDWWCCASATAELVDSRERRAAVHGARPLFYFVRRGGAFEHSLDRALLRQALALGVDVRLGSNADRAAVDIDATGPAGRPMAVVRGVTFRSERADLACTMLSDHLAPGGYVYLLVADGHATLATVLLRSFRDARACFERALATAARLHGLQVPAEAPRWGGYACFEVPRSARRGGVLVVGEAAGFQDALFGFGLRSAIASGVLAARSLTDGSDYDTAWRALLLRRLQASRTNRALYNLLPAARGWLWHGMAAVGRADRVLRPLYAGTLLHRCAAPLVWLDERRRARQVA